MSRKLADIFASSPVITAVKDEQGLEHAMDKECSIVFILFGNICNIGEIVEKIKAHGKLAVVHVDLIAGLGQREIAVDFIRQKTRADGIISTKPALVKRAMELGIIGGQRTFLIDSMAMENTLKQLAQFKPDFVEVLPGVVPKVIRRIHGAAPVPLVAGGLLTDKQDVVLALQAGADAVSTTREELWDI